MTRDPPTEGMGDRATAPVAFPLPDGTRSALPRAADVAQSHARRQFVLLDFAARPSDSLQSAGLPFLGDDWTVEWVVRAGMAPPAACEVTVHTWLAAAPPAAAANSAPSPHRHRQAPRLRGLRRLARTLLPHPLLSSLRKLMRHGLAGTRALPQVGLAHLGGSLAADSVGRAALVDLLNRLGPDDALLLRGGQLVHLEWLLELLPYLRRDAPIPATLRFRFTEPADVAADKGKLDLTTLSTRLASGFPFHALVLEADTEATRARMQRAIGLPVFLPDEAPESVSLRLNAFAPLALVVSALWGRVGSSVIFDAQTRHLIRRGYVVVRMLVDHWPHMEPERSLRISGFLAENFQDVRPHAFIVAERRDSAADTARVMASADFKAASVVGRVGLLLRNPLVEDPLALAWAATRADVAVVNHLPHLVLTETLTPAPVILVTHDIYTDLIAHHGVPDFVPRTRPNAEADRREEQEAWRRAAVCLNFSPEDHARIAPVARSAFMAQPYLPPLKPSSRSWKEIVTVYGLPAHFADRDGFDILLWGSWHEVNVKSIADFVRNDLMRDPLLQSARVIVAGRVVLGLADAGIGRADITMVGFVDSIGDLMGHAHVLVIPDADGSGVSIKMLEALASGRPFAATRAAMRGLHLGVTGFVPAADAAALGRDVAILLGAEAARRERAAIGAALYELNVSEAAQASSMDAALAAAAAVKLPAALHVAVVRAKDPPPAQLTAVVCTYRRYELLAEALDSLLAQRHPVYIVVVDNSPDQAAATAFKRRYAEAPWLKYLLEPTPGLSNARNRGVAEAITPLVAFLDDDAIAGPDWSSEIIRAFEKMGPATAVVGGRVVPRWVSPRPGWLSNNLLGYLSLVDWGGQLRPLRPAEWLAGCNIAFRRDAVLRAGGFASSLGRNGARHSLLSNEETELIDRIRADGGLVAYAPDAIVEHVIDPARLTQGWFRRRAAWHAVSILLSDTARAAEHGPRAVQHIRLIADQKCGLARLGYYPETRDSGQVNADVAVAYDLVMAMLHDGGAEPWSSDAASSARGLSLRLRLQFRARALILRHPRLHALARAIWRHFRRYG